MLTRGGSKILPFRFKAFPIFSAKTSFFGKRKKMFFLCFFLAEKENLKLQSHLLIDTMPILIMTLLVTCVCLVCLFVWAACV